MPRLTPTLKYLYDLQTLGIKPGLRRVERLLSLLGNPEKAYPSVIVAGTNGKGSVSAMIASVLTEAGYRVGHYSSPHLFRFNERIRVSGVEITNKEISSLTRRLRALVEKNIKTKKDSPSFFEFTTVMAFEHFRKKHVDIVVLEVGMGGRFDATNVVDPLVSVITNIGLDHGEYLGTTIKEIAGEKAGVIKEGGVLVTSLRDKTAMGVIKKAVKENKARAYFIDKGFRLEREGGSERMTYQSAGLKLTRLTSGLKGSFQMENTAVVIRTIEHLNKAGFKVGRGALRQGLRNVVWPGRFDMRRARKRGVRVVFDCAHNEAGARALRAALEDALPYGKVIFVVGVMKDKDIDAIFSVLIAKSAAVIVTEPDCARSASGAEVFKKAAKFNENVLLIGDVATAIACAIADAHPASTVCVTGSIFTVGEALSSPAVARLLR